ncbi:ankyrin repeat domain-containing protein [Turneriella parva]|uniref:Ankyrin n=1 Tax=Turneriella parva (strain ATCC BAA-1111 / DSM 21527 / NCTC 11395 / H) TaxID=869212 RepID=I4B9L4_TURPD|nr:ankyrin repeat domain-containing protein [Turneriella parva]AFM13971.1 Ankyrin [Turneriella parva DSM 21527]
MMKLPIAVFLVGAISAVATEEIIKAVESGNSTEVKRILALKVSPNILGTTENFPTPAPLLSIAAFNGDSAIVELLLAAGADINKSSESGENAVFWPATLGHTGTVKILIKKGINVNTTIRINDISALHSSSGEGHAEIVKMLVKAGAELDGQDATGKTALMAAAIGCRKSVVEILISAKADLNIQSKMKGTALTMARDYCKNKQIGSEIVNLLKTAGAR